MCNVCVVCGAAWHAENPLCVDAKRLRVYVQDVSVCTRKKRPHVFNIVVHPHLAATRKNILAHTRSRKEMRDTRSEASQCSEMRMVLLDRHPTSALIDGLWRLSHSTAGLE